MPDTRPLSQRCSLLAHPGEHAPTVRPAECPKNAAYIHEVGPAGGHLRVPGSLPIPIVFEGGSGNDRITVIGQSKNGVYVDGGAGDDSMVVISDASWLGRRQGLRETDVLVLLGIVVLLLAAAVLARHLFTKRRADRS